MKTTKTTKTREIDYEKDFDVNTLDPTDRHPIDFELDGVQFRVSVAQRFKDINGGRLFMLSIRKMNGQGWMRLRLYKVLRRGYLNRSIKTRKANIARNASKV